MTQHSIIHVNNKYQTVQEWLSINNSDSQLLHPERNYASVVEIWNSCVEIHDSASDEDVMTILQGPILLPRNSSSPDVLPQQNVDACLSPRFCRNLLVFCYYFIFVKDPYGFDVSRATLHSPSLGSSVSFYTYISQYWKRDEWVEMLRTAPDLDLNFQGVAQRQQDIFPGFTYEEEYRSEKDKWVTKRIATFKSSMTGNGPVWIGPLNDWVAVFEFDEFSESIPIEGKNRLSGEHLQQAFSDAPKSASSFDIILDNVVGLIKDVIIDRMLLGIIFSFFVYYLCS